MDFDLSEIPNKKYFSIKEVSKILDIDIKDLIVSNKD